jgi:hypothetical protein
MMNRAVWEFVIIWAKLCFAIGALAEPDAPPQPEPTPVVAELR